MTTGESWLNVDDRIQVKSNIIRPSERSYSAPEDSASYWSDVADFLFIQPDVWRGIELKRQFAAWICKQYL